MTTSTDELRKVLLSAFRMPSLQTPVSRKSSVTNAFVNAIIPVISPTHEEIAKALEILEMSPGDVRCAYCRDASTEWDHLRPLVKDRRPTGYISEIANLVPACGKCNQSKGNSEWRIWIRNANARHSPTGRGLSNIDEVLMRLEAYELWRSPTRVDFEAIVGRDEWENYWNLLEAVITEMRECQSVADSIRASVCEAVQGKQ